MDVLSLVFALLSIPLLWSGMLNLCYLPLSLAFELRRLRSRPRLDETTPLVSIVVPAYNEGRVIVACVESILASPYPNKEIILVNDGSTDDTLEHMRRFSDQKNVIIVDKPNGGKASALNAGLAHARGEFIFCVDADGIFTEDTIPAMLRAFDSPYVGAVCGSDAPINLDRPQTHLAAIQTHVGTGFVRRALSFIGCLPIVSGNIGAFRRSALARTGGFRAGLLGEDLELTWRMHRAGYDVRFAPDALVLAEVPSTVRGLWKQRVRWARGYLQTAWLHRDMIGNPRFGPIGPFLALNFFSMVMVPILQLSALASLVVLVLTGANPIRWTPLGILAWVGLFQTFAIAVFALVLDRAWHHARYLYAVIFWLPYSLMLSLVMVRAIYLELRRAEQRWNKLDRVGISAPVAATPHGRITQRLEPLPGAQTPALRLTSPEALTSHARRLAQRALPQTRAALRSIVETVHRYRSGT